MTKEVLQWHPAFYAGIQIEFEEEKDNLIFENEHQLGTKPKEIDVLIIKKQNNIPIQKNIGRIFRKHNIVEYKSPRDYLNIDDFYKVCAYACFYKSDTVRQNSIPITEITITFVCKKIPSKLVKHLEKVWSYKIREQEKGIYYIYKGKDMGVIPMQIIVTSKLGKEENLWLRSLTDDLKNEKEARYLVKEYEKHKNNKLYESMMDIIVRANYREFQEVKGMCKALEELMADVIAEREKEAIERGLNRGMAQGIEQGMAQGMVQGMAQGMAQGIEQGIEQGRVQGEKRKLIELVCKKLRKGKSFESIAEELEEEKEIIQNICEAAVLFAPDYECDKVYDVWEEGHQAAS